MHSEKKHPGKNHFTETTLKGKHPDLSFQKVNVNQDLIV